MGTRPKAGPLTLRVNNGKFRVKINTGQEVFDDGSKLGLMGTVDLEKNIVV